MPERGPEASLRMSLAIFISEAASVFRETAGHYDRVVGGEGREFVGMRAERQAGELGDFAAARSANSGGAFSRCRPPFRRSPFTGRRGYGDAGAVAI